MCCGGEGPGQPLGGEVGGAGAEAWREVAGYMRLRSDGGFGAEDAVEKGAVGELVLDRAGPGDFFEGQPDGGF